MILERSVRTTLVLVMRSSFKRELRGLWLRGEMPRGATLLAANHHSWWDGHVVANLSWSTDTPLGALMADYFLARTPFFKTIGVIGAGEVRVALRWLAADKPLFVFPEGRVSTGGALRPLLPGVAWLARKARVPVRPVAIRCVLRGHRQPEAYVWVGEPSEDLERDLNRMLEQLDFEITHHAVEREMPGFRLLLRGDGDQPRYKAKLSRWLKSVYRRR